MNARVKQSPAPAVKSRVQVAHEALNAIAARLDAINAEAARIASNAQASPATATAQSLRQQRTSLLAKLLKIGRVEDGADIRDLNEQVATAEQAEKQAQAIADARDTLLAALQIEAAAVDAALPAARRELAEARFAAARDDLQQRLLPAYLAAADHLRDAYAALAGAGRAHYALAAELSEVHGVSVAPLGQVNPLVEVSVTPVPPGFGLSNTGGFNILRFDVGPELFAAQAAALSRWRSA
jgi:hypothetical protein